MNMRMLDFRALHFNQETLEYEFNHDDGITESKKELLRGKGSTERLKFQSKNVHIEETLAEHHDEEAMFV